MRAALLRLYALLLRLYPPGFRAAFGEEMQSVFADRLDDTPVRPALAALLREFFDLPAGLAAAWRWSFRHASLLAPRHSLVPQGAPGAFLPESAAPTPWVQALLAGLPFLLLALVSGLPGLLNLPETGGPLSQFLVYPLVLAGAGSLIWSVLRGWPRWAAGWYLLWLAVLSYPLSSLFKIGDSDYQLAVMFVFPLVTAWLLYRLARRDRITAVLAGLPAMLVVWVPFMEQTPITIIPAPLRGGTFFSLFLLSGLAAVLFLRTNRLGPALALAFSASAVGGSLAAYAGIYHGGMLSFSEPGPSPRAVLEVFLPAFVMSAAIAAGPLLARALRNLGLRAGRPGRVSYRVALFGLLLMLVLAVLAVLATLNGGSTGYLSGQRLIYRLFVSSDTTWYRWGFALAVYMAGFGWLAFSAEQAGVLPRWWLATLLFLLPVGVPLVLLAGPSVYMGWVYSLRWLVNALSLLWLAASVWLVLQLSENKQTAAFLR